LPLDIVKHLPIFIITGLSGSGKSTALAALEDTGFYCVDNLPVSLLPKFLELPLASDSALGGLVFVMDMRGKTFLEMHPRVFGNLRDSGYRPQILFLEAEEQVLVQRFSETRRQHPLAQDRSLLEAIRVENERMHGLRQSADKIIDTSHYNVHQFKALIKDLGDRSRQERMGIQVLSFGFKFGVPYDADLVMDVRFIKNPHFVAELKDLDGESTAVRAFVLERPETQEFLEKFLALMDYLIPLYQTEGKSYLTLAIGCTGGHHRSVAIAREVFQHLDRPGRRVTLSHRDRER
jgi:UPF0042 nucleotide-binding protein